MAFTKDVIKGIKANRVQKIKDKEVIKEQKLPKYKRFNESTDNKYIDGWNACLDEITKKG